MSKIIMIDAGHGGRDSGGVNKRLNVYEKDVVLNVADYMDTILKLDFFDDIASFMTREDDRYVSLKNRCEVANNVSLADAFISIHTNARLMTGKYGLEIETYYHPGSIEGKIFANIVQKNLLKMNGELVTIDRGVKTAKFYVLKHTRMPAILVELGFLSDFEECVLLSSMIHQQTMGAVLADSVGEYLLQEIS